MTTRRHTSTADGSRLAYDVSGGGETVMCIQGVGVIGKGWQPQIGALSACFTVITNDNRGIGGSSAADRPLTIEAMADDVFAILDAESARAAHLVGHSMGGLIALAAAVAQPSRVKSLALLCTFANGADATKLSARMLALGLRTRVGTRAMRRNAMLEMIMPAEYLNRVDREELATRLADLFGHDLADQPPIAMPQLRATARLNLEDRLDAIGHIPTLIACGAHDPIAPPESSRIIARHLKNARLVEFPDASHALPIQKADDINRLLLEHLTSVRA